MARIPIKGVLFRNTSWFAAKGGVDAFLLPTLHTRAREVDLAMADGLRNGLFQYVGGSQIALDLAANNIQRGRDHALPRLNQVRQRFGLKPYRRWSQVCDDMHVAAGLRRVYGRVERVELWPGLLAERHMFGSLGETGFAIWPKEFGRLRVGDRLFYRHLGKGIDRNVFRKVRSLRWVFQGRFRMRDLILRNSDIDDKFVPDDIWRVAPRRSAM